MSSFSSDEGEIAASPSSASSPSPKPATANGFKHNLKATSTSHSAASDAAYSGTSVDRQYRNSKSGASKRGRDHSADDRERSYSGRDRYYDRNRDWDRNRDRDRDRSRDRDRDRKHPRSTPRSGLSYSDRRPEDPRSKDPRRLRTYDDDSDHRSSSNGARRDRDYLSRNSGRERDRSRDRFGYPDKRPRHRSRSPSAPDRRRDDGTGNNGPVSGTRKPDAPSPSPSLPLDSSRRDKQVAFSINNDVVMTTDEPPQQDLPEPVVIDEEAEIERRKRRRAELLAKTSAAALSTSAPSTESSTPEPASASLPAVIGATSAPSLSFLVVDSPATADTESPATPTFDGDGDNDMMKKNVMASTDGEEDGPSAADYDPMVDKQKDDLRDEMRHHQHEEVPTTAPKDDDDGDDDDDDDMFAEDFDVERAVNKSDGADAAGGLLEEVDKDGYYKIRISDVLGGRYQLQSTLGKGMFSGVARAVDLTTKELVAVKIIRNNDALRKGGLTEVTILQKLNAADPHNRKHIIRFDRSFEHKGHLCMVFENLSLNLREVLKKFGNNVGINLTAVRAYAYQMFVALAHMESCSIIHADLKPDNILVNENRKVLKICDLGTAIDRSDAATAHDEIAPYLVSRFYRAPEIILGIPYDYAVDMWSIGCTLYELYTGKILFTGDSNNQMLKAMQEIRGRITPKMFRRGQLAGAHFDDKGNFVSVETDGVLGTATVKVCPVVKSTRDLRQRLLKEAHGDAEAVALGQFVDLLEHCLALNPDRRLKPAEALRHGFFKARI